MTIFSVQDKVDYIDIELALNTTHQQTQSINQPMLQLVAYRHAVDVASFIMHTPLTLAQTRCLQVTEASICIFAYTHFDAISPIQGS